jgi:hypothetical protein
VRRPRHIWPNMRSSICTLPESRAVEHALSRPRRARVLNLAVSQELRLPAVGTLKEYSKALEYEYRVKTATLGTLKRYSILSLTLYLE